MDMPTEYHTSHRGMQCLQFIFIIYYKKQNIKKKSIMKHDKINNNLSHLTHNEPEQNRKKIHDDECEFKKK